MKEETKKTKRNQDRKYQARLGGGGGELVEAIVKG